jgi:hypothetical protein
MDCEGVRELLDAYALGAAERAEAEAVERHVAGCLRCTAQLAEAQEAAASLAIAVPLERAPETLGRRVISAAEREASPVPRRPVAEGLLPRVRFGWQAAAGALGAAGVAALVFAGFLQVQVSQLQDDKEQLETSLESAGRQIQGQDALITLAFSGDAEEVTMPAVATESDSWGVYTWSREFRTGAITCHDFPPNGPGEVYQAWFATDADPVSAGTFSVSEDGSCIFPMDLASVRRPRGIGVSKEPAGGSAQPTGRWLVFASFGD